jgi:uncharacterized protein YkwD
MSLVMRRIVGALALLAVLGAVPAAAEGDPDFERAVVAEINQVRAQHRLSPLRIDPRLTAAARDYARELAQRRLIDHTGRDGRHVNDRIERQGYIWGFAGENLAANAADARETVERWMASPGHRANVLSPSASDVGAAREIATDPGNPYRTYDVLVLARPRDQPQRRSSVVTAATGRCPGCRSGPARPW